jgi:hypothetical protein
MLQKLLRVGEGIRLVAQVHFRVTVHWLKKLRKRGCSQSYTKQGLMCVCSIIGIGWFVVDVMSCIPLPVKCRLR